EAVCHRDRRRAGRYGSHESGGAHRRHAGVVARPRRAGEMHVHRSERVHAGGVAELALIVFAPALHKPILCQRARVAETADDGDRIADALHLYWSPAVAHGAVAELAEVVLPPAPDAAVRELRARIHEAGIDRRDVRETGDGDRRIGGVDSGHAQLLLIALAPALDRDVLQQRAA